MKRYKSLYEMSNIFPEESGVPYVIWVSTKSGKEKHGPRVKVDIDGVSYTLMILSNEEIKWVSEPNIFGKAKKKIIDFVSKNKQPILDHWNGLTSSGQFSKSLKKV
jgi:hypothetical protein